MQRDTQQQRAIRKVFNEAGHPLSPHEVLKNAQVLAPKLGIATVYRVLKGLMLQGWLTPVELPGEPQRYEVAGKPHHHHFSCRGCRKLYKMEGCPSDIARLVPPGFHMEDHELIVYGLCDQCRMATL